MDDVEDTDQRARILHDARLEESRSGRRVISAFLIVTLACWGVAVLPDSIAAPASVREVANSYLRTTGTFQGWKVFSPPRHRVVEIEARVAYDDGSTALWRLPRSNQFVGSYFDYHWQKYAEHAANQQTGDDWPRLREPLARYVAREMARPRRRAVSVTLITKLTENLPIEDDGPSRADTRIDEYFTLDLEPKGEDE